MFNELKIQINHKNNTVSIKFAQSFITSLKIGCAIVLGVKIVFKCKKLVMTYSEGRK